AVGLNQPLTRLFAALELRMAHAPESSGDATPVRAKMTVRIDQLVPMTALRWTIRPVPGACVPGRDACVVHRPPFDRDRRRSSVDGTSGLSMCTGVSGDPAVWPMAKNRARRRASASLEFTGKVA